MSLVQETPVVAGLDDTAPLLVCENVSITYSTRLGPVPAVMDFNLNLPAGGSVGIVGESGCGKSTVAFAVLRYLSSNAEVTSGRIYYRGRDIQTFTEAELRSLRGGEVAMVYQEPMASLNPSMRVGKQLIEVLNLHPVSSAVSDKVGMARVYEILEEVRLPDPERIVRAFPHQLSGGQQQRVCIAMALLGSPRLLLLDEPTTALDVTVEASVVELIKSIAHKTSAALVYISHNLGLILQTCQQVCVMYSGQSVEASSSSRVFQKMRHPYTRGLFNAIPRPGTDRYSRPLQIVPGQLPLPQERPKGCTFGPRCGFYKEGVCNATEILEMKTVENDEAPHFVRCERFDEIEFKQEVAEKVDTVEIGKEVILSLKDFGKTYQINQVRLNQGLKNMFSTLFVKANKDITFDVRKGETFAIIGESGCGKSTAAKVMLGLETSNEGELVIKEVPVNEIGVQKRSDTIRRTIQIIFQNPFSTLNPSHTVNAQLRRVLSMFQPEIRGKKREAKIAELLNMVNLSPAMGRRKPRQLSGGQKQRISIARAFAAQPEIIIADEPVSALDVLVQASIIRLLTELQAEEQTTLVVISHDLSLVRYLANTAMVMYLGRVMEIGPVDAVYSPPFHPYTEALLGSVPPIDPNVKRDFQPLEGELPSPLNPPAGCPFNTRCPRKIGEICETEIPPLRTINGEHKLACHLSTEELMQGVPPAAAKKAPAEKTANKQKAGK